MIPGVTASRGQPPGPQLYNGIVSFAGSGAFSAGALIPGGTALWIAVGATDGQNEPVLMISEDTNATTWTDRSSNAIAVAPTAVLIDVCYSPDLDRWLAVGYKDSPFGDPVVVYSDDGGNAWTAATPDPATDFMIQSVCWTGSKFIAVGKNSGSSAPRVMNSADGISWTQRTSAPTTVAEWYGVRGISGLAVAVGGDNEFSGPRRLMTSSDHGDSWTANTPSFATLVFHGVTLVSGGGTHIVVGPRNSSTIPGIGRSTDGTSWTEHSGGPTGQQYLDVAWNGSIYAAVGYDFSTGFEGRAGSSADGTTWTARTTDPVTAPSNNGPNWLAVAAADGGGFVAVGRDNNGFNIPYVMYSADALTWTARSPNPSSSAILMGIGSVNPVVGGPAMYFGSALFAGVGNLSCNATIGAGATTHSGAATFAGAGNVTALPIWPFVPTDLATVKLWLDASDTATITDAGAGAVSAWDDKSSSGNDVTQATGAARPTTGANTLDGKNVLTFNGANTQTLRRTASVTLPSVADGITVCALRKITSGTSGGLVLIMRDGVSDGDSAVLGRNAGEMGIWGDGTNSSASTQAKYADADNTNWHLSGGIQTQAARHILEDGAIENSNVSAVGTGTTDELIIGLTQSPDRATLCWLTGQIAEVVVISGTDTTERQKVEGYIMWKWGLEANLPGGHPYAGAPP